MMKKSVWKKHSRYTALLTAAVLMFSSVGTCMNVSYAEEITSSEETGKTDGTDTGKDDDTDTGKDDDTETGKGDDTETGEDDDTETGEDDDAETGEDDDAETGEDDDTEIGEDDETETGEDDDTEIGEDDETETGEDDETETGEDDNTEIGEDDDTETGKGDSTETGKGTADGTAAPEKSLQEDESEEKVTVSYFVDPEEGATVKGPSEVKNGRKVIFTVSPELGYVIDQVTADNAEVALYNSDSAKKASSSNAESVDKDEEKTDFSKPQKYIIESLEEDTEVLIMMEYQEDQAEDSVTVDGVTIKAQWDSSNIPATAKLKVTEVTREVRETVIEGVEANRVKNAEEPAGVTPKVKDILAYDIVLEDGDKVYDTWDEGTVKVTFSGAAIEEKSLQADEVSVVHLDDETNELTEVAKKSVLGDAKTDEISFEAEHFSMYSLAFAAYTEIDGVTITDEMNQDAIDAAVATAFESNKTVIVEPGNYSIEGNNHKKIIIDENQDRMTIYLKSGEYTRAQIITRTDSTVRLYGDGDGKVTFDGETSETGNTSAAIFVENGTLTFDTNDATITIQDYNNGLRVGHWKCEGDAEFNLTGGGTFDIEKSVVPEAEYTGNGYDDEQPAGGEQGAGFLGSGIVLLGSGAYQRLLTVNGATLNSNRNAQNGVYRHNNDTESSLNTSMGPVVFENNAEVHFDGNGSVHNNKHSGNGYYDEAYNEKDCILQVSDSSLSMCGNAYNGYNYGGKSGRTGRNYSFVNSIINTSHNYNTNAGLASGTVTIDHTTWTASGSEDSSGFMQMGGLKLSNSTLIAEDNKWCGLWTEFDSSITDSTVIMKNNGSNPNDDRKTFASATSGIYVGCGTLSIQDSTVELIDNGNAISYGSEDSFQEKKAAIKQLQNAVIKIDAVQYDLAGAAGDGFVGYRRGYKPNAYSDEYFGRTFVMGGSMQATTAKMRYGDNLMGMQFTEINPRIDFTATPGGSDFTANYAAPINDYYTALTRFDLNQAQNLELRNTENQLVYYDPHTHEKVDYLFRYNEDDEDLDGKGGNAYVWAPVSVLHYDSTQGMIPEGEFKTARKGNVALTSSRGDKSLIGNAGIERQNTARYATDYTIFGNSMNISQGVMPEPVREGYKFIGWFTADDEAAAQRYAEGDNFEELYKLLNTRFTETSKVSENIEDVSKGQAEKTVYAKWALPSEYTITVNYINKSTGEQIATSYTSGTITENGQYDVTDKIKMDIADYTWDSYKGVDTDAMAGNITQDLVFNVYYIYNGSTSTTTPPGGSSSGGHDGGGSSSGGHSTTSAPGGPGTIIEPNAVPLASLPNETEETTVIPEEEVPLAELPKTGDEPVSRWIFLMFGSILGLCGLWEKKKKEDNQ